MGKQEMETVRKFPKSSFLKIHYSLFCYLVYLNDLWKAELYVVITPEEEAYLVPPILLEPDSLFEDDSTNILVPTIAGVLGGVVGVVVIIIISWLFHELKKKSKSGGQSQSSPSAKECAK